MCDNSVLLLAINRHQSNSVVGIVVTLLFLSSKKALNVLTQLLAQRQSVSSAKPAKRERSPVFNVTCPPCSQPLNRSTT